MASIFVEGISKRYFKGLSPEEYNHNKARKCAPPATPGERAKQTGHLLTWCACGGAGSAARIARKERRKHEALEDQKRLAKTKMREEKLRRMERLMEGTASPPQLVLARHN